MCCVSVTIDGVKRAISNTSSKYLSVALFIQKVKSMRRNILSSVAFLTITFFPKLFHTLHNFRKRTYRPKTVYFLYHICLKNFSFYNSISEILSLIYTDIHVNYTFYCQILM